MNIALAIDGTTPPSVVAVLRQAASLLGSILLDPITLTLGVSWSALPLSTLSFGGPRVWDLATSPQLTPAQEQVLGMNPGPGLAGSITLNSNVDWSTHDLFDVIMHEMTHALGRSLINGGTVALSTYTYSSSSVLATDLSQPHYFSLDGGRTALAHFDMTTDPGDWAAGSPPDAADASIGAGAAYPWTGVDSQVMSAIGLRAMPTIDITPATLGLPSLRFLSPDTTPTLYESRPLASHSSTTVVRMRPGDIAQLWGVTPADLHSGRNNGANYLYTTAPGQDRVLLAGSDPRHVTIAGGTSADIPYTLVHWQA